MSKNFLTLEDTKISNEFKRDGYVIRSVADKKSLNYIQSQFIKLIKKNYKFEKNYNNEKILNFVHKKIKKNKLNDFRLKILNQINKSF